MEDPGILNRPKSHAILKAQVTCALLGGLAPVAVYAYAQLFPASGEPRYGLLLVWGIVNGPAFVTANHLGWGWTMKNTNITTVLIWSTALDALLGFVAGTVLGWIIRKWNPNR